jgi:hypothetical protein
MSRLADRKAHWLTEGNPVVDRTLLAPWGRFNLHLRLIAGKLPGLLKELQVNALYIKPGLSCEDDI